jgi:hypothetical protein
MSGQPAVIVDVDDTLCDISEIRHRYALPDEFRAFTTASRDCLPRPEVLELVSPAPRDRSRIAGGHRSQRRVPRHHHRLVGRSPIGGVRRTTT